jgi:hypothetical protein
VVGGSGKGGRPTHDQGSDLIGDLKDKGGKGGGEVLSHCKKQIPDFNSARKK